MIIIKKAFVLFVILAVLLSLTAVSAGDVNQTDDISDTTNASDIIQTSSKTSTADVYVLNSDFDIQILDDAGKGVAKGTVKVKFNEATTNLTTDDEGHAYFKLNAKGYFKLSYTFNAPGYTPISASKTLTVVKNSNSKIKASNYVAYEAIKNPYAVTLTTGGVPLAKKEIIFKINGKTYTKTTNSKGQVTLNINLSKKTYTIKYTFKGVENAKSVSGTSKITVKKGAPTKIVRQNPVSFRHQTSTPMSFKYVDVRGNTIPYKAISLKINGKTYTKKTDKNGLVTFKIKQNKGIYAVTVSSSDTSVFKKTASKYTIKVKSKSVKNNGFWLFGADMKKVNLTKMAEYGVKHIFLNAKAFELHGKSSVADFATEAKSLGIKVHIWIQTFYKDGGWLSPVSKKGVYNYKLFKSIIKKAKYYANTKGVSGIHFDYLRFPGNAYKHTNGVKAINYFVKTASNSLHKYKSSLIVSAAIMPEPSVNKHAYGQDIATISKYLDVLVPMVYKGNYNAGVSWIKSVTSSFVAKSKGAQVWCGLQGYSSDEKLSKLSASALTNDADYAGIGGARGVIIFRYALFNFFNFDNL